MMNITKIFLENFDFLLIIGEIFFGSFMAFIAILTFSKQKKFSILLFVLTAVFLYIGMCFRILGYLNIFFLEEITINNIPVFVRIISILPLVTLGMGFIMMGFEAER